MIDREARFGRGKLPIQSKTAEELYQYIPEEVFIAPKRVVRRGTTPCAFGKGGSCCKVCNMGPCQVVEGIEELRGICGATAATVVARNFARMVAAGTSAHSDHGRHTAHTFYEAVHGEAPFKVKDSRKLRIVAQAFGVDLNLPEDEMAKRVAEEAVKAFGQQEGELKFALRAPQPLIEKWRRYGVMPRGVDREVVETLHRTSVGVDQDYRNILLGAARCSLADGWGGSMIATELQDVMLGTPVPVRTKVNIGLATIKKDHVNVVVHGHDPILAEALAVSASDPEIVAEAKKVGAKGVNLAGICCTGNEVLMRYGIPVAGSFMQQEAAIGTGAIEAIVVDVQCIMMNIVEVAKHFHTLVITTSPIAKMPGAHHIEFESTRALEIAKEILKMAISRYPLRDNSKVRIPEHSVDVVVGFSHETIMYILGGRFRASYKPLNENVINGRILGVAAIVGCDNYRVAEPISIEIAKELIANNVLILATGCAAVRLGTAGLLRPEAAELAGPGLREVLEAVGCPPVLHMGSCVDNSRILLAATEVVRTGGLGEDIYQIPAVGSAPEWMSEKAIAIGMYFVTSGVQVVFGPTFPTLNSKEVCDFLFNEIETYFGGNWRVARTANEFVNIMIDRINFGRRNLGIDKPKPRILYDMAMRRALAAPKVETPQHLVGYYGPISLKGSVEEKKA